MTDIARLKDQLSGAYFIQSKLTAENERLRGALTEMLADLDDPDLIEISAATIARARQALNIHLGDGK